MLATLVEIHSNAQKLRGANGRQCESVWSIYWAFLCIGTNIYSKLTSVEKLIMQKFSEFMEICVEQYAQISASLLKSRLQ